MGFAFQTLTSKVFRMRKSALPLACLFAIGALTLSACSSEDNGNGSDDPAASSSAASPISMENCGEEITVDAPPQKIVSLYQSSTEILLSLGAEDRMVGTSTWFDPVLPELEEANSKVPRIAENFPSFEAVLDTDPDFVVSSITSIFGEGGVATREQFSELGVPTYISPTDCVGKVADDGDGYRNVPYTLDMLYREITELSDILDLEDSGAALIDDLEERIGEAESMKVDGDVTAMYWFAGDRTPYMAGCCGAPGLISSTLGVKNVFDDSKEDWPEVSWESVAEKNPDVIVLADLTRDRMPLESAQEKIDYLEGNPVTKELDAVKNKRYITMSGQSLDPSIRNVYELPRFHSELAELGLAEK